MGSVLVAALAVCVVLYFSNLKQPIKEVPGITRQPDASIVGNATLLKEVSVNGIDISGMTKDQATVATSKIPDDLLNNTQFTIDVAGNVLKYTAKDLGLTTDYNDVMAKAFSYGQASVASQGEKLNVNLQATKENVMQALQPLVTQLDKQPVNASVEFMPWGNLADGTAYTQDQPTMIKACANGKTWIRPNLVRISADQMPDKYRYEYWQNTKYIQNYIPADANISRFQYKDGTNGQSVDLNAVADSIIGEVQSGNYATIEAPVTVLEPTVKLSDVKNETQLIASWTSSYSNHYGYNRNWNVAKLSGIINGQVIQPGQEWSINKTAGDRTVAAGWQKAPGIENGGYTDQPGGGVCQISSTTYNAAIRAGLTITEAKHHSIRSNYIPLGLDATISSGSPDLKIKNPYNTPIYIVSYVNPADKNVTVEIYGSPVTDPQYGQVILDFTSQDLGTYGTPTMNYIYNTKVAPDGHVLSAGESYPYAEARKGQKAKIFKITMALDGTKLNEEDFGNYVCDPINGITYVNGPDPATLPPSPTPTISPSPSTPTPTQTPMPSLSIWQDPALAQSGYGRLKHNG